MYECIGGCKCVYACELRQRDILTLISIQRYIYTFRTRWSKPNLHPFQIVFFLTNNYNYILDLAVLNITDIYQNVAASNKCPLLLILLCMCPELYVGTGKRVLARSVILP